MKPADERSWRKEILALVPPAGFAPRGGADRGRRLLEELSRRWRVFWAPAPWDGERVPMGGAGLDPVVIDTLPAATAAISRNLLSGVVLVGTGTVRRCIESVHAFASHLPLLAVLDEPWPAGPDSGPGAQDAEFALALADWIGLTSEALRDELAPYLRRSAAPAEALPALGASGAWTAFGASLSRRIPGLFKRCSAPVDAEAVRAVLFLGPEDEPSAPVRRAEWSASLRGLRRRTIVAPKASWSRRLARDWGGTTLRTYRDRAEAIGWINRLCAAPGETLVATGRGRLHPMTAELLLGCARRLPLVAAVGCQSPARAPEDWKQWVAFAHAWSLRYRGSYRVASRLAHDCLLLSGEASQAIGAFDPRLEWPFAVRDYCLRSRQAEWRLFVAEDAAGGLADDGLAAEAPSADVFIQKWKMDPLHLLRPAGANPSDPALTGARAATTISRLGSKNGSRN